MIETLKKQWFVVLIALILVIFTVYIVWDTNKGKLAGKSADGKDVVATISDKNIFADDVFESFKGKSSDDLLFAQFQNAVASQAIETTADIKAEVNLLVKSTEDNFKADDPTNYKNTIQSQLDQMGYDDLEDYSLKTIKVKKMLSSYMDENMDSLFTPIYTEKKSRLVSHILVKMEDSANPTEEEQAKITEIETALSAGKTFEEVATQYSDDTSSATNGGSVGYTDSDTGFVEEFLEKSLELNKGEVSDWVKVDTPSYKGWHKIKVVETDQAALLEDETTKEGIYNAIMNANPDLAKTIVWEKSKDLEITFANDEIKKQLMDYMGITEEEAE